jgi:hypothetical protein
MRVAPNNTALAMRSHGAAWRDTSPHLRSIESVDRALLANAHQVGLGGTHPRQPLPPSLENLNEATNCVALKRVATGSIVKDRVSLFRG